MKKGTQVFSVRAVAHDRSSEPENTSVPYFILALLALLAGIFLRVWQLGDQILLDDEWHAVHKLLHADAHDIATHLGLADYSIPLTLYYRFLYLYPGLSEWGMRLPMLTAGIALLVLAPWLLRRYAAPATLSIWTALLALSPFLIYHTRTARPYALTTLLVFVAIVAFWEWWRSDDSRWRWRWALIYIVSAFLAGWLHLITLPFTLLPFIFCGIAALRNAQWRRVLHLILLGMALAVALLIALLPPLLNDFGALAGKSGSDAVSLDTLYRAALLAIGSAHPVVFVLMAALCAAGVASWWRRDAAFVGYLALIIVGSGTAIACVHPAWVQHPGTYARYLQPVIPFLLLFMAEGAALALVRLPVIAQAACACAALVLLFTAGPIPGYAYAPNQFMGHPYFQFDYDAAHNPYHTELPDGPIPAFYRRLSAQPAGSLTLIETPWSLETNHDPEPLYQHVHHQYVRIGLTSPLCGVRDYGDYPPQDAHMQLTQFTHVVSLLSGIVGDADLLVVHRQAWPPNLPPAPQWPPMSACLPQFEQRFGAPIYRDGDIDVFALSPRGAAVAR